MIRTGRAARRLLLVLGGVFALGVALELHGYSISAWRHYIDDSAPEEILLGKPRPIRSDDWNVIIPLSLAQRAGDPAFPPVNDLIGLGQSALVPFVLPVGHPLAVFRPATWGYSAGDDIGLAWQWWSQLLGLFGALALFLLIAARGRVEIALAAALLAVGSPFVLFWSLRTASVPAFGALAGIAALGIATARRPAAIWGSGALLGWAGGCFALEIYPPFQIPTALLFALVVGALLFEERDALPWREQTGLRIAALALGLAIPLAGVAWLFASSSEAISALRSTSFPGRRVSLGGERELFEMVGANLALAWKVDEWGTLVNICESAGFLLLGLPLAAAALARREGSRLDAVEGVALAVLVALGVHAVAGIPEWLARASGFALVPGRRSMVALGLADALLAARLLSRPGGIGASRSVAIAVGVAWAALLAGAAQRTADTLHEYPVSFGIGLAVANGALVVWAAAARRGTAPLAVAAAASLAVSIWFNPLARGGSEWLRTNPLSREILAIDAERGGESTWVAFAGPYLPNLFRAIGVHALNGLHPIPQPAIWRQLDPDGRYRSAWNRYAHLVFVAWPRRDLEVRLLSQDSLVVSLHPRDPALRALGVTDILVDTDAPEAFEQISGHRLRASVGRLHLFETRWDAPGDAARATPERAE